jgi:hypothetical protein
MRIAIFLQLLWVIGSIFLNLNGLDMVESSDILPSPLPSMGAIYILLAIGILQLIFYSLKMKVFFRLVSLAAAVYAGINIYKAFLTDPEIWENASWQWSDALLNLFGLVAGLTGVFSRISTKGYQPDPISPDFKDSGR